MGNVHRQRGVNYKETAFYLAIFIMVLIIAILPPKIYPDVTNDEKVWQRVSVNWLSVESQSQDNKSPLFLLVNHLLRIDLTVFYTRLLNYLIMLLCIVIIYSITKRWESILFILIPFFSAPFTLLDISFELLFILLSLKYEQHSGIFTGLAMIFRPYAIVYTLLLERKQQLIVFVIGACYAGFLLISGVFWAYLHTLTSYGSAGLWQFYPIPFIVLVLFAYAGSENKKLFKYGLVACIPLLIRTWGHYFIVPTVMYFLSYLSRK